ncbi:NACHT domain-containing protein [Parabacteroides goldsteinii]|uniref:NACHT domain-containing protein n=1 Tax=Parabacteroides goldsteinii TaxID=328812 RepID=UPI001CCC6C8D|nr:NACHT domain-containing protein [Parabacteroides goldsteinii]UBD77516.1 NACHT domain-containing protein [Parabacteroides goldsteinii]
MDKMNEIITKAGLSFIPQVLNKISDEIKFYTTNRLLEYKTNLYRSLSSVKTILHRNEVLFKDIYEPIKLISYNEEVTNPSELFEHSKNSTIIGEAGIGKSSLIKFIILDLLEKEELLPILIELRNFNKNNVNILEYINNEIFKFEQITDNDIIQNRLLESGRFCIFFDGFDEISKEYKSNIINQISKITNRYTNNKYVITSRPNTEIEYLPQYTNYTISYLDTKQIYNFIKRQFKHSKNKNIADLIIESIKEEQNQTYLHYLKNPLLLSLFILSFDEYAGLPQQLCDFFRNIFETLLYRHNSFSKMGFERKLETGLSKQQIETLLKVFSFISFFDKKYIFNEQYFEEKMLLIKERKGYNFNTNDIESDLVIAIGILHKDKSMLFFPHKTLHEYFTVLQIAGLSKEQKKKVYTKFRNEFLSKNNIEDLSSFYRLLMEIDYYDTTELLQIPMLEELQKIKFSNKKDLEDLQNRFFWSLNVLSFFNFEDYYYLETIADANSLKKKIITIKQIDIRHKECNYSIKSETKKRKKILKEIEDIRNSLEIYTDPSFCQIYNNDLILLENKLNVINSNIADLDTAKIQLIKEKKLRIDQVKNETISFIDEVNKYLDIKIIELKDDLSKIQKADDSLIDML